MDRRHPRRTTAGATAAALAPDGGRGSIFISYGRENLAAVEQLTAIGALGGDAWFDKDELSAGNQWEKKSFRRFNAMSASSCR